MSSKQQLAEAEALVTFANLEEGDVETFKTKHTDFVPADWWTYRKSEQWKMSQRYLRDAWEKKFEIGMFELMRLLTSCFDPTKLWEAEMDIAKHLRDEPAHTTLIDMDADFLPCQRALMFLNDEKWRVRICACGKRYVADHPRRRYCAIGCPVQIAEQKKSAHSPARKKQKRKWWKKHGRAWRKTR
jgi:hypothetical protein